MALKTCLSPAHWVALAINHLRFLVARNVILKVILVDIVLFSLLMTFFVAFKEITDMHGIIFKGWLPYTTLSGLCIIFSIFGFIAVFRRKVRLTQVYFGLFVLSLLFCILVSIPIFDVECGCDSFRSCHDLKAFQKLRRGTRIFNSFMPPKGWTATRVLVPYEEAPADRQLVGGKDSDSSFLEVNAAAVSDQALIMSFIPRSHQSFIQRRHGQRAGTVGGRAGGEHLRVAQLMGDGAIQAQADDEDPQPEQDREKLRRVTQQSMAFYKPIDHHIRMTNVLRTKSTSCPSIGDITITDYNKTFKPMVDAWNKRAAEDSDYGGSGNTGNQEQAISDQEILHTEILAYLWHCLSWPACEGVLTYVLNKKKMHVCEFNNTDLVPTPASEKEVEDSKDGVFWLKMKAKVAEDKATGQKKYTAFEKAVDGLGFPKEVVNNMDNLEDQCRCQAGQDGSCRYYKDANTSKESFWCYVEERMTSTCQERGVQLFRHSNGKLWSPDLCSKEKTCACSTRGELPLEGAQVHEKLIHEGGLNYGSSCAVWNKDIPWEWCFVGVDSACADRNRSWARQGQKAMQTQFWSLVACNEGARTSSVKKVKDVCNIFTGLGMSVVIFLFVKFLPMAVTLFAFLANRCGDHVEDQEQWQILDSEEEDTDQVQDKGSETRRASTSADGPAAGQGVRFKD